VIKSIHFKTAPKAIAHLPAAIEAQGRDHLRAGVHLSACVCTCTLSYFLSECLDPRSHPESLCSLLTNNTNANTIALGLAVRHLEGRHVDEEDVEQVGEVLFCGAVSVLVAAVKSAGITLWCT